MGFKSLNIKITQEDLGSADLHIQETDGKERRCILPIQHVAGILDKSMVKEEVLSYSMLHAFPEGYVDCCYAGKDDYIVCLKKKGRIGTYLYQSGNNAHAFLIPYPDMLFIFQIKKGVYYSGICYAVRKSDQVLCRWPFANVYDDGRICWGSNEKTAVSFSDSHKLADQFLETGFNTHLYDRDNTTLDYELIEDLIRFLQTKKSFLDKWLMETKDSKKPIKDIFTDFCKKCGYKGR